MRRTRNELKCSQRTSSGHWAVALTLRHPRGRDNARYRRHPCAARAAVHLDGMRDPQSQMYAAMKDAQRALQRKRAAGEALRTRQLEHETAKLRGRQQRINRARAAL